MISNKRDNWDGSFCHVLGLTGGIGTGKSTAAEYLVSKGFKHIDADAVARELTADGSPVLQILANNFGDHILDSEGCLDRKALADIVFNDPVQKQKLDDIMFSRIGHIISERIEDVSSIAEREDKPVYVLLDAPLLFEAGLDRLCDKVLLLTCDIDTRLDRVTERDDSSREEVRARIRSQMSDEEKKKKADFIVDNSGSIHALRLQLDDILMSP